MSFHVLDAFLVSVFIDYNGNIVSAKSIIFYSMEGVSEFSHVSPFACPSVREIYSGHQIITDITPDQRNAFNIKGMNKQN